MPNRGDLYKCQEREMLLEVIHGGEGEPELHGKPMKKVVENTVDAAKEKHVPVIQRTSQGCRVMIGSVPHPMESSHYIEWIELRAGDRLYRQYLKPGQTPSAEFPVHEQNLVAREYCNLHGLWKA
ncbi:MAG: desulfoferrodoxin [Candidatus Glassbacteria bacterium RIFCSPLOWO2_12_FULL_58_11]|uniref:Desulfoferrodoxin n=2 Tax=Candidatus Glassiibacteriota TaxID=1817805 RepID=A0A1F5YYX8_9BACT|nr:MAG: desulfoferrodoxin [Candidatus Glassbacteria bacterium GWA2_58_10]OGG05293.1 MAG: desulfoferrodoxin [Candidatus Glassbacteria bacterium RIFCSPLOWO2_12_FULL_58_11]